jgi:hypothetical protein
MLDPPHCLQLLLWRLCSQMLDPPHSFQCTVSFGGCARRCSTRRIPYTCFLCGCARRCSSRRIVCIRFFCGCARRCSSRRIPCTRFFGGCARRCSTRRIACTCFFRGCAGTSRAPSSQCLLLPPSRPLPPHAAPSLPCRLPRTKDAFSSPQFPLSPCLETLPPCVWSLSASCR